MAAIRRISYFSEEDLGLLRGKVLELLSKRGVKMEHPDSLKLLAGAGAGVDSGSQMVRFPPELIEERLEAVPSGFSLFGKNGRRELTLPRGDGAFWVRTNTGAQSWIEPASGVHRPLTLADIGYWAGLVDRLEHIDFIAYPVPSDAPSQTADVHALRALLANVEKHVWVQPHTAESLEYLIRLSALAAGGEESLKTHPPVSFICCSLTPLSFKYMDLEIIHRCGRRRIPLHACSLPGAGTTGPITEPGTVLLAVSEILAMVTLSQIVQPGLPVIATPLIFSTDMRTGKSLQASVESMRACALAVQLIRRGFDLPTHTYGVGADGPSVDYQNMSEGALRALLVATSGADILGGAGQLEVATTISPVQLAIDNEVMGMVRRLTRPMKFDSDSLAWETLMQKQPGGQFLTDSHTLAHCRDALLPINFTRSGREQWQAAGRADLLKRAEGYLKDLPEHDHFALGDEVLAEMDAVVAAADRQLVP